MINWTITVASPLLTVGMSFQVKYRKLPSTNWIAFLPNPTTNTFTISNIEEGYYEAEIRTVCANGELSIPVYHSNFNPSTSICDEVIDLTFIENTNIQPYEIRSFTFNWTRQAGKTYRLEFQKNGFNTGYNDSVIGINLNQTVTINSINADNVRVVTICVDSETESEWISLDGNPCPGYTDNLFISDLVFFPNSAPVPTNQRAVFKLNVLQPFIGFVKKYGGTQVGTKAAKINFDGVLGADFTMPTGGCNTVPFDDYPCHNEEPITLAVGVYDLSIEAVGAPSISGGSISVSGGFVFLNENMESTCVMVEVFNSN